MRIFYKNAALRVNLSDQNFYERTHDRNRVLFLLCVQTQEVDEILEKNKINAILKFIMHRTYVLKKELQVY